MFFDLSVRENLEPGAYLRSDKDGIARDFERSLTNPRVRRDRRHCNENSQTIAIGLVVPCRGFSRGKAAKSSRSYRWDLWDGPLALAIHPRDVAGHMFGRRSAASAATGAIEQQNRDHKPHTRVEA